MQELTRNRRSIQSDKLLIEVISKNPGLSQYELTKRLNWQIGKVDGAIRRLVNENQITIKSTQRNGRLVNLVYPKENQPQSFIAVPTNLLQFTDQNWQDCAFVYALDHVTIGIAGREMPEWAEIACFTETIPIKKVDEMLVLELPVRFSRFYGLERHHRVVSVNGNAVLVTIAGSIVEEKKYPS